MRGIASIASLALAVVIAPAVTRGESGPSPASVTKQVVRHQATIAKRHAEVFHPTNGLALRLQRSLRLAAQGKDGKELRGGPKRKLAAKTRRVNELLAAAENAYGRAAVAIDFAREWVEAVDAHGRDKATSRSGVNPKAELEDAGTAAKQLDQLAEDIRSELRTLSVGDLTIASQRPAESSAPERVKSRQPWHRSWTLGWSEAAKLRRQDRAELAALLEGSPGLTSYYRERVQKADNITRKMKKVAKEGQLSMLSTSFDKEEAVGEGAVLAFGAAISGPIMLAMAPSTFQQDPGFGIMAYGIGILGTAADVLVGAGWLAASRWLKNGHRAQAIVKTLDQAKQMGIELSERQSAGKTLYHRRAKDMDELHRAETQPEKDFEKWLDEE